MNETYEYIDAYFTNTLTEAEREAFEDRCVNDTAFANNVALYVASRQAVRDELLQAKQQQWVPVVTVKSATRKTLLQRILPYAAAACVIIAVALYFIINSPSQQSLAHNYMQQHYAQLSVNMGKEPDTTLQTGIYAYNSRQYKKALKPFVLLEMKNPGGADEKKYLGLVYLMMQDYDKALAKFDELANIKGLHNNPGNFFKAVTLMERGMPGDTGQVKQLLQQVVNEKTEGEEAAKNWLEKM